MNRVSCSRASAKEKQRDLPRPIERPFIASQFFDRVTFRGGMSIFASIKVAHEKRSGSIDSIIQPEKLGFASWDA